MKIIMYQIKLNFNLNWTLFKIWRNLISLKLIQNLNLKNKFRIKKQKKVVGQWWIVCLMTIDFYKTTELNVSSCKKITLRSSTILNIGNNDHYCFPLSTLAQLHCCEECQSEGISNYSQSVDAINLDGLDFSTGFKRSVALRLEKKENFSVKIIEIKFYRVETKRNYKVILLKSVTLIRVKLLKYWYKKIKMFSLKS